MKKFIGFLCLVLVCFGVKSCMSSGSNSANNTASKSHSSKVKKNGLKIYKVDVTSEKVEHDGDSDDCFITIKGDTDAPDGSIVYAQDCNRGGNLAYGNDEDDTDNKVKNHHVLVLFLASDLFDLDKMKVGQAENIRIFCTNQSFKYSFDDSEVISKKVRRKVENSDIEPYPIKVTQKMVDVAQ